MPWSNRPVVRVVGSSHEPFSDASPHRMRGGAGGGGRRRRVIDRDRPAVRRSLSARLCPLPRASGQHLNSHGPHLLVMRDRNIRSALTTDSVFERAGLRALLREWLGSPDAARFWKARSREQPPPKLLRTRVQPTRRGPCLLRLRTWERSEAPRGFQDPHRALHPRPSPPIQRTP
jgi:hypothetical protein